MSAGRARRCSIGFLRDITRSFHSSHRGHRSGTFDRRIDAADHRVDEMARPGWDEGPVLQSEHAPRHREVAARLIETGWAYRDFAPEKEVEALKPARSRKSASSRIGARIAICRRPNRRARADAGETFCVRLARPDPGQTIVADAQAGQVVFEHAVLSDFVLLGPDQSPVYNFACASMTWTCASRTSSAAASICRTRRARCCFSGARRDGRLVIFIVLYSQERQEDEQAPTAMRTRIIPCPSTPGATAATSRKPSSISSRFSGGPTIPTWKPLRSEQAIARFDGSNINQANANFDEDKFTWNERQLYPQPAARADCPRRPRFSSNAPGSTPTRAIRNGRGRHWARRRALALSARLSRATRLLLPRARSV